MARSDTTLRSDLDSTLVDSGYQYVLAWKEARDREGVERPAWRIHRRIGMSGGLFAHILLRETGLAINEERFERLRRGRAGAFNRQHTQGSVKPPPG